MKRCFKLSLWLAIVLAMVSGAYAATFKVIYTFGTTGSSDAYLPKGTLISDKAGNLYGTTVAGGPGNAGTVFELSPDGKGGWTEKILYGFTGGADGNNPVAGVVFDSQGNLYGTTEQGGISNPNCGSGSCGVVFELSPSGSGWTESVLYSFTGGADGQGPDAPLVLDAAGNLYGTTTGGGITTGCYYGCGVAFELEKASGWTEKVLHTFQDYPTDGANPVGGLAFDATGNLLGTTTGGGDSSVDAGGAGTVFKLTPNSDGTWTEKVLYGFCAKPWCADGNGPEVSVIVRQGRIFGTTINGGGQNAYGTVFEIAETASGTGLHAFALGGANGAGPVAPVLARGPNLFGVTQQGGIVNGACSLYPSGNGVVFKLAPQNGKLTETVLYSFTGGSDGCGPSGGMTTDVAGNLYGTTYLGGSLGLGVVFEVTP